MELSPLLADYALWGDYALDIRLGYSEEDACEDCSRSHLHLHTEPVAFSWDWIFITTSSALKTLFPSCLADRRKPGRQFRLSWTKLASHLLKAIVLFIIISTINAILHPSYSTPPAQYKALQQRVLSTEEPGRGNVNGEKIFIAANIINEELVRGSWGRSLLQLIDLLGEDKVFVSIYENDSGDETRDALQTLQSKLPCNSSVVTGAHLSLDRFPSVHLPSGEDRVQRITYLSEVRNRLLRPLDPVTSQDDVGIPGFRTASGLNFDKILFLNDVFFSPLDAVQLLFSTNEGKYRTACAIDFVQGVMFYDSFVVRDTEGFGMGLMFYPWFSAAGSAVSRNSVRQESDAVPVRSCWGGMAAFDAAVFRGPGIETTQTLKDSPNSPLESPPNNSTRAISFRGSNESFWEAAECCLVFADIEARYGSPSIEHGTGVMINPYVRVAYTETTFKWLPFYQRYERIFEYLQYIVSKARYPEHNPRRLHEPGQMVEEVVWPATPQLESSGWTGHSHSKDMTPSSETNRGGRFTVVHRKATPGGFCGQRRMFVMKQDLQSANTDGKGKNWEKISVPSGL